MSAAPPRPVVLVCEDKAHETVGHYGIRFAELAQGFREAGHDTYALTSLGWAYGGDAPFPADRVLRYEGWSLRVYRYALRAGVTGRWRSAWRNVALALAVRTALRRLGNPDALVVVLLEGAEPALVSLLGAKQDWIVHRFAPMRRGTRPGGMLAVLDRLGRLAAARRAAQGNRLVVALPDADWIDEWHRQRPWELARPLRLAGAAQRAPVPNARAVLGLPAHRRIAILFGAQHGEKLPMVAVDAIRQRPDWTLAVVGMGAAQLAAALPQADRPANLVLRPGAVSNTDRGLWHQVADVAVLSFVPGYRRNSGTLMDALSAACPVVVSDESFAAELVQAYQLGEVFAAGNAVALAAALDRVAPLPRSVVDAALADLGNERLARDHLAAVGR